jgi:hypothetical protein
MAGRTRRYTPKEALPLATALYERLRPVIEPGNEGKIVALDLVSGDHEVDANEQSAFERLIQRQPDAHVVCMRVGGGPLWRLG